MKPVFLSSTLQVSPLILIATLFGKANPALSQSNIVPDDTLGDESSQVTENFDEQPIEVITGGAQREQNLFHSFQEFNVSEGRGAYFNSPNADIQNIFSRVTGSNASEIMGVLGTFGESNPDLYLINPNGIIFGENSSLDVQGSFTATTAEAIEFGEGGLFSAVAPGESLLTISVPLGLQFGSSPGSIINRSFIKDETGDFVGLQVPTGENLTLVGGEILFDAGEATAKSGNIYLGGLGAAGGVSFGIDGSLSFPDDIVKADVNIINFSDIDVTGAGSGSIEIDARNINIEAGGADSSSIRAGITANFTPTEAQSGDIVINATDKIMLLDSIILNRVDFQAIGNAGNIVINTGSLQVLSGGEINSINSDIGNSGGITISATESVIFDKGTTENTTGASSQTFGTGNSDDINIFSNSLKVLNGAQLSTGIFGDGDAGDINIIATDSVAFDGRNIGSSGAFAVVDSGIGNSGNINISTNALKFSNNSQLSSSNRGTGNAGNINITSNVLEVLSGSQILAATFENGDGGNISINANDSVVFDNEDNEGRINSGIYNLVETEAEGNAGNINISTASLEILNGAQLSSSTRGIGNAGSITVNANNLVFIDGENLDGSNSGIYSISESEKGGNGGEIVILTDNLEIYNGGLISSSSFGKGNVGSIDITAFDSIIIDGQGNDGNSSGVFSSVQEGGIGSAGALDITTDSLTVTNDAIIITSTLGQGNGGEIEINANSLSLVNNGLIISRSETNFDAGNIILDITDFLQAIDSEISTNSFQSSGGNLIIAAGDIELRGDSDITTNIASGEGSGGNIAIEAGSIIAFDDSDIFAFAADGEGGNITLDTPAFFAENFTLNSLTANPRELNSNNRADVNATGAVSGAVDIPDVSFIQNSLTELPDNSINTDALVANSCVVPAGERSQGKFIITGSESLPVRPGDDARSMYPTGEVRGVTEDDTSSWQPGDPIVEPQGAYRLANGKLVLSRECSQQK